MIDERAIAIHETEAGLPAAFESARALASLLLLGLTRGCRVR